MYFYTIVFIPSVFFQRKNRPPIIPVCSEGIMLLLRNPDQRFPPTVVTFSIFICGSENFLRTPQSFAHTLEICEAEVI